MLVSRDAEVTVEERASKLKALFDSGLSFTIMGYDRSMELFGEVKVKPLIKPGEAALLNGQRIIIDGLWRLVKLASLSILYMRSEMTILECCLLELDERSMPTPHSTIILLVITVSIYVVGLSFEDDCGDVMFNLGWIRRNILL
jgi:hypothetical protein